MPEVLLGKMSPAALSYITHNLRDADAEECLGAISETPDELASNTLKAHGPLCRIVWLNKVPAAVVGAVKMSPGQYCAYAYGTAAFPRVVLSITKYIRRIIQPTLLLDPDANRCIAIPHANHVTAHRWLEHLGAECEGRMVNFGRDGSDYLLYVWTRASLAGAK